MDCKDVCAYAKCLNETKYEYVYADFTSSDALIFTLCLLSPVILIGVFVLISNYLDKN